MYSFILLGGAHTDLRISLIPLCRVIKMGRNSYFIERTVGKIM